MHDRTRCWCPWQPVLVCFFPRVFYSNMTAVVWSPQLRFQLSSSPDSGKLWGFSENHHDKFTLQENVDIIKASWAKKVVMFHGILLDLNVDLMGYSWIMLDIVCIFIVYMIPSESSCFLLRMKSHMTGTIKQWSIGLFNLNGGLDGFNQPAIHAGYGINGFPFMNHHKSYYHMI